MRETLKQFFDRVERETWRGLSTAFRSGARAALIGGECRYGFRRDFEEAWRRGFEAMRENLAACLTQNALPRGGDFRLVARR